MRASFSSVRNAFAFPNILHTEKVDLVVSDHRFVRVARRFGAGRFGFENVRAPTECQSGDASISSECLCGYSSEQVRLRNLLADSSPKRDADAVPGTPPDLSPLMVGISVASCSRKSCRNADAVSTAGLLI